MPSRSLRGAPGSPSWWAFNLQAAKLQCPCVSFNPAREASPTPLSRNAKWIRWTHLIACFMSSSALSLQSVSAAVVLITRNCPSSFNARLILLAVARNARRSFEALRSSGDGLLSQNGFQEGSGREFSGSRKDAMVMRRSSGRSRRLGMIDIAGKAATQCCRERVVGSVTAGPRMVVILATVPTTDVGEEDRESQDERDRVKKHR